MQRTRPGPGRAAAGFSYIMTGRRTRNDAPAEETVPTEETLLLPHINTRTASMAPVLPISASGGSPPRAAAWSLHNGLMTDVESQSASSASDGTSKLNSPEAGAGILSKNWCSASLASVAQAVRRSASLAAEPTSSIKAGRYYWGGSRYVEKYLFVGVWMLLLICSYGSARISAHLNLAGDSSTPGQDPYDSFEDISRMLQFGFLLGWFVGVFDIQRFAWLFHWRQIYWVLIFIGTPPVYSAISRIPAFQHSLADFHRWGGGMWILFIIIVIVALTVVIWHGYAAWTQHSKRGFAMYLGSRFTVQLFYLVFGLVTARHSVYSTQHIHHYYIAWSIALFAEFNHPISAVTLAIAMGAFVQGIGVYGFASLFEDNSCFTASAGSQMSCDFMSTTSVDVKICPQNTGSMTHSCYFSSGF